MALALLHFRPFFALIRDKERIICDRNLTHPLVCFLGDWNGERIILDHVAVDPGLLEDLPPACLFMGFVRILDTLRKNPATPSF